MVELGRGSGLSCGSCDGGGLRDCGVGGHSHGDDGHGCGGGDRLCTHCGRRNQTVSLFRIYMSELIADDA